jgi:quercetin dioxygenase-like cupin family protein
VLEGELEVTVDGESKIVKTGETLRYRGDRNHMIENVGDTPAHASMILALKLTVVE